MANVYELLWPALSGDAQVDALLGPYVRWEQAERSADHALRFSFALDSTNSADPGAQVFSAEEQAAARLILTEVSALTGIEFIETTDAAAAQLHFSNADSNDSHFASGGEMVVDQNFQVTQYDPDGYVVLDNGLRPGFATPYGSAYQLLLHEIGHAMNLKHPHDGFVQLDPGVDDNAHSVMTYQGGDSWKASYQALDVAALQWRYGTDGLGGEGAWTRGAPLVYGSQGDDLLQGGSGNDFLYGDNGRDTLIGGEGNDLLYSGSGAYRLDGGSGDDSYIVFDADTPIVDASGVDTVYSYAFTSWTLAPGLENLRFAYPLSTADAIDGTGNASRNLISGNAGPNVLTGLGGNDSLYGLPGNDTLVGGAGADLLRGGFGDDQLSGGPGSDRYFFAEWSSDTITGFETGIDRIELDGGKLTGLGAPGRLSADDPRFYSAFGAAYAHDADDRLIFDPSTHQLSWDADGTGTAYGLVPIAVLQPGTLSATDIWIVNSDRSGLVLTGGAAGDALSGGSYADVLTGGDGTDTLTGRNGDDHLDGGASADRMNGGRGDDTYIVSDGDVIVDSSGIDWVYSTEGSWHLGAGLENLALVLGSTATGGTGNSAANRMVGNELADTLTGAGGDDTLIGGGRADRLQGGAGNDSLTGGTGNDSFLFANAGAANADLVMDFGNGNDNLRFSDAAFAELGAAGRFDVDDGRFYAAAGASEGHDPTDRIVYDTVSGQLYYDADGSGSGGAQLVATLTGHPTLTAQDIVVF